MSVNLPEVKKPVAIDAAKYAWLFYIRFTCSSVLRFNIGQLLTYMAPVKIY
jgi:hypothetical protein